MKKIAMILFAALTAVTVSLTACQQQSDDTPSSVPESSIEYADDSITESVQTESIQESEPVSVPEISADDSREESSEPDFIEPIQTQGSDYQSVIVNNKCRLLLYTGTEQRIIVPDKVTVNGKEYETEIGAGCFKDTNIITLDLPDNITEIPDSMCENCKQLTSVAFWNVTSIGKNAFWECESWKFQFDDLNYGKKDILKKIGETAFGFSGLYGKVTITPDMELEDGAFQICQQISEAEIQSGVTVIPDRLFAENHSLEKITLPETVTKIGEHAFSQNIVKSIVIPKSVTEIGIGMISTHHTPGWIYTGIIIGYKGSAAEKYAGKNDIVFSALD